MNVTVIRIGEQQPQHTQLFCFSAMGTNSAAIMQVKGLQQSTGVLQKLSLQQAVQQVIRQEGIHALWKGNGVTMLHRLPYSAVNFWAYEQFTQQWQQCFPSAANHSQDAVLRRLAAGGAAGMCACTLVSILSKSACFCGWIMYDPMQTMLQMMLNVQINSCILCSQKQSCMSDCPNTTMVQCHVVKQGSLLLIKCKLSRTSAL